jgi:hypothetical protein
MTNPLAETLRALDAALRRLGIAYVIGGSMASSARATPRSTLGVDIVAAIAATQAAAFAKELGADWYADPFQIRDAIAAGRAFNVIHMTLGTKVDVFPATEDFHRCQLERATPMTLPFLGDSAEYPVASAEDIVLAKLQWYKAGGETSERQWSDVASILGSGQPLDLQHMETWAKRLGVSALLARALAG